MRGSPAEGTATGGRAIAVAGRVARRWDVELLGHGVVVVGLDAGPGHRAAAVPPSWFTSAERTAAQGRDAEWAVGRTALKAAVTLVGHDPAADVTAEALAAIEVAATPDGRPIVPGRPGLAVSLAHSRGLVLAAAVAAPVGLGIDVECATQHADLVRHALWGPDAGPVATTAVFTEWTVREAVLKAWGCGLSVHPRGVTSTPGPRRAVGVPPDAPARPLRHHGLAVVGRWQGHPWAVAVFPAGGSGATRNSSSAITVAAGAPPTSAIRHRRTATPSPAPAALTSSTTTEPTTRAPGRSGAGSAPDAVRAGPRPRWDRVPAGRPSPTA